MTRQTAAPREGDDGTAGVGGRRERTKGKERWLEGSCWLVASPATQADVATDDT